MNSAASQAPTGVSVSACLMEAARSASGLGEAHADDGHANMQGDVLLAINEFMAENSVTLPAKLHPFYLKFMGSILSSFPGTAQALPDVLNLIKEYLWTAFPDAWVSCARKVAHLMRDGHRMPSAAADVFTSSDTVVSFLKLRTAYTLQVLIDMLDGILTVDPSLAQTLRLPHTIPELFIIDVRIAAPSQWLDWWGEVISGMQQPTCMNSAAIRELATTVATHFNVATDQTDEADVGEVVAPPANDTVTTPEPASKPTMATARSESMPCMDLHKFVDDNVATTIPDMDVHRWLCQYPLCAAHTPDGV